MAEKRQRAWWQQPRWWVIGASLLFVLILADVVAAFTLPLRLATHIAGASAADQLKAESDLRSAILSLLGALTPLVALIAGAVALLNFQETRRQNLASLEVARRGQVTDRFTAAIEQLGADDKNLDIRIGAIYALEQIAKDSEDLHWPVIQILTTYLREHSGEAVAKQSKQGSDQAAIEEPAEDAPARADFLAVADVVRRRRSEWDAVRRINADGRVRREPLNLQGCDLRNADLREAQLESANFEGARLQRIDFGRAQLNGAVFAAAQLEQARFVDAQLDGAIFERARLRRAVFAGAHLHGTDFVGAQLQDVVFEGAQLKTVEFRSAELEAAEFAGALLEDVDFQDTRLGGARFTKARLKDVDFQDTPLGGADFREAHLKKVSFVEAQLREAKFEGARLEQTDFEGAKLTGADFRGVDLTLTNVTQEQLDSAICNQNTMRSKNS
jgi:uncharacterized protein YjbI with pentapeptide repeats